MQQHWGDDRDPKQRGCNRGCQHFPVKLDFTILSFSNEEKLLQVIQFVSFTLEKKILKFWFITLLMAGWTILSVYFELIFPISITNHMFLIKDTLVHLTVSSINEMDCERVSISVRGLGTDLN